MDIEVMSSPYGKFPVGSIAGYAGTAALTMIGWFKHISPALVDPSLVADVDWGKAGTGMAVGIAAIGTAVVAVVSKSMADRREHLKQLNEIELAKEKARNEESLRKTREENALLQASRAHEIAELKEKLEARDAENTRNRTDLEFLRSELAEVRRERDRNTEQIEALKGELKDTRHALRGEVNTASLKAEVAQQSAEKVAEKVKDLKGKLTDSRVIEDDGSGTAEHPTQG